MSENPLVTISMITYNQEKYVRDAVRGLLSQTYEPLEIVISDDHSTDKTWDVIVDEVEGYKHHGGIHRNIILNRNEKNMGIILHAMHIRALCHGVLRIGSAGDDICLPDRVAKIVERMLAFNNRPMAVMHRYERIDRCGRSLGIRDAPSVDFPLGAVSVFDINLHDGFPEITERAAFEDHVFVLRALMKGEVVSIDDVLLKYRLGVGITSGGSFRGKRHRNAIGILAAARQSRKDLEYMRSKLSIDKIKEVERHIEFKLERYSQELVLCEGKHITERFNAFKRVFKYYSSTRSLKLNCLIYALPLVLPYHVGDLLFRPVQLLWELIRFMKYR